MMRLVKACICAAVLAAAAAAQAEPLNLKHVAANAGWVAHIDFDATRDSTVVQKMWQKAMEKHKNVETQLKMVEGLIGMNPAKDIRGLTLYGKQIGKHSGVAIVHAKMKKELLQPWIDQIPKRESSSYGAYAIQSWTHEHKGQKHTVSAAWHGGDRIVVASGVEDLKAALDVIDGKAASVGLDSGVAGNVPAGTHVLLRVTGISSINCNEPLVKQTESFRMVAGEHNGESFHRVKIVMNNAETAGQLKEAAEGLRAIATLATSRDPATQKLVKAGSIKLEDKTLTMLWSAPAADVYANLEKHLTRLEKHLAKHREHRKSRGGDGHKPAAPPSKKSADDDF